MNGIMNGMEWNEWNNEWNEWNYILYPEDSLLLRLVENGDTILEYSNFIANIIINTRVNNSIHRVGCEVGLSFDFNF